MNIKVLKEFSLNKKLGQVRACEVSLGKNGTGMLFAYSENFNIDPCESGLFFHKYPMELALFGEDGQMLWHRTLPMSLVTGTWLMPFLAFDLDGDGIDEIWFVSNTPGAAPLNARAMRLERVDALSGKTILDIHFPAENTEWERLGHAYRFFLCGGYVKGEPVFLTIQGTYGDIFIQCYNSDMTLRWDKCIPKNDGSLGSHSTLIFDFNSDGIEELLYGEHLISLDNGEELICFDKDRYHGHSDVVLPFVDNETNKMYIFTARESGDYDGCPRVVTFDMDGNVMWEDILSDEWGDYIDDGHMHYAWVANIRAYNKKIAYAHRRRERKKLTEHHIYDAVTGENIEFPFPYDLNLMRPIDINGDGYHEFLYWQEGHPNVAVIDSDGKDVIYTGGILIHIGKHYDFKGEQFMVWYPEEGKVRIWGDIDAIDSEMFIKRYENGFLKRHMKTKGNGYNWLTSVDCAF